MKLAPIRLDLIYDMHVLFKNLILVLEISWPAFGNPSRPLCYLVTLFAVAIAFDSKRKQWATVWI